MKLSDPWMLASVAVGAFLLGALITSWAGMGFRNRLHDVGLEEFEREATLFEAGVADPVATANEAGALDVAVHHPMPFERGTDLSVGWHTWPADTCRCQAAAVPPAAPAQVYPGSALEEIQDGLVRVRVVQPSESAAVGLRGPSWEGDGAEVVELEGEPYLVNEP